VTRLSKARGSRPRRSREYPIADYDGDVSADTRRDGLRRKQGETIPPCQHAGETVLMKPPPESDEAESMARGVGERGKIPLLQDCFTTTGGRECQLTWVR
jgi:hypothetical protein